MLSSQDLGVIRALAWTDFKLRYRRSILGFFWSLLKPLLMLATLYTVFSIFLRFDVERYPLFLLLGILLWNFFAESTTSGLQSIFQKGNLVKKGGILKTEVIVVSVLLTNFFSLALNLLVFFIFAVALALPFSLTVLALFLFLLQLFILSLGLSFGLAALNLWYGDIRHVWDVLLQIGFWATPIVYPVSAVPKELVKFYMLNPLARIINDSRDAVIFGGLPSPGHQLITWVICFSVLLLGYAIFRRLRTGFGERL